MFLGRVRGEMVATLRHRALEGRRLLWVERTAPDGSALGRSILAVDHAQAGEGDLVLVLDEGNGASQVLASPRGPIRTVIVGIVDEVDHTEYRHVGPVDAAGSSERREPRADGDANAGADEAADEAADVVADEAAHEEAE